MVRGLGLLFASAVAAHSGLKTIIIDDVAYPPFNEKIDPLLQDVRRIEWSHDIVLTEYNPITKISDPALACQPKAVAPKLKAIARAGADVTFKWTELVRMHQGPIVTYLGYLPSPDTKPTDIKFFKIDEKGFDSEKGQWANQIAQGNGDKYSVKLPSDIKAGTYVLRTELIALHGNMKNLDSGALKGPQFYPYCVNVEIVNSAGSVSPEGVTFPGAYKADDYGIKFQPYMTYDSSVPLGIGNEQNSKYIPPGPAKYAGKYDAPIGQAPVVKETGYYPPDLQARYDEMYKIIAANGAVLSEQMNRAWPGYTPNTTLTKQYGASVGPAAARTNSIKKELMPKLKAFQKEVEERRIASARRFFA